jgi:hypothetical protein
LFKDFHGCSKLKGPQKLETNLFLELDSLFYTRLSQHGNTFKYCSALRKKKAAGISFTPISPGVFSV